MTEEEYQEYLDDLNKKFVWIGCSEIPRQIVNVVRVHYEKKGIHVNEEAILEEAREKYDHMYLKADGRYAHETNYRKTIIEQGFDPDEIHTKCFEYLDAYYENMKATDPAAYQETMDDMRRGCEEVQKLREARQERYREVHQISERDRLERTKLIAK